MTNMGRKVVSWALYAGVAFSFAYAGVAKAIDPERFLSSVLTYEAFPYGLAVLVALFIPWLELVVAFSLVTGIWRCVAARLAGAMLVAFIALIVQAGLRGLSIDCGCYGSNELDNAAQYAVKIGEDLLLLLALWGGVFLEKRRAPGCCGGECA